jgi:hypothetical protein
VEGEAVRAAPGAGRARVAALLVLSLSRKRTIERGMSTTPSSARISS